MPTAPDRPQRHNSLRHPGFDYTSAGAYFVTICAAHRVCLFGEVAGGCMQLNPLGHVACSTWPALVEHHACAKVDEYVVMPNHVHALIWLQPLPPPIAPTGTQQRAFGNPVADSLSTLIGSYKSSVTQQAKRKRLLPGPVLWQRNFYDNIVRNAEALARIREYIRTNPARWHEDQLHPDAPPNPFNRA